MRQSDVPASLLGEERHCFGVWACWWLVVAGKEGWLVQTGSAYIQTIPELVGVYTLTIRSQIRRDYPLNLSISLSGGKETNQDSPSNGE